jgi:hypothetical protein
VKIGLQKQLWQAGRGASTLIVFLCVAEVKMCKITIPSCQLCGKIASIFLCDCFGGKKRT